MSSDQLGIQYHNSCIIVYGLAKTLMEKRKLKLVKPKLGKLTHLPGWGPGSLTLCIQKVLENLCWTGSNPVSVQQAFPGNTSICSIRIYHRSIPCQALCEAQGMLGEVNSVAFPKFLTGKVKRWKSDQKNAKNIYRKMQCGNGV